MLNQATGWGINQRGADGGKPLPRKGDIENAKLFRSLDRTFVAVFVVAWQGI
ncbi:protein of unknown function [Candidatus Filomicrobium marinum]|uniref:Transposase n=1 Tax=Candidatus Filomicrobium marinum TaxID=1608628 RepID=A0A0D6JE34_9HYPH|nr:protein of unknown function [Candidatus Filomicrobium marinum]CPR18381.1 protein of unknown function [Candidatus Filomicrobium marinum]